MFQGCGVDAMEVVPPFMEHRVKQGLYTLMMNH